MAMSRIAFRRWAETQDGSVRYERVLGEPVAMAPERAAHARLKARIWQQFDAGIRSKGLPCEALPDGITVEVGDDTDYEPDALVNCGPPVPPDAVAAPSPVIVVEVLSPSTRARDAGAKLDDYFRLPTVAHYLLVKTERRAVIHHRRRDDGAIETRILSTGVLHLDPPGLDLDVDALYAGAADPG